jgi:hypothetical protein
MLFSIVRRNTRLNVDINRIFEFFLKLLAYQIISITDSLIKLWIEIGGLFE